MKLTRSDILNAEISVIYPSPEKKKNSRFGYSVEALSLATLIRSINKRLKYYDFSLSRYGSDFSLTSCPAKESSKQIVFLYVDSVPLHRSSNADNAIDLSKAIKSISANTIIVACGPWCMLTREMFPYADITFFNEAEYDLLQIFNGNESSDFFIKPLLLDDLSALPIPDRELLPIGKYDDVPAELKHSAVIQTTRGCRNRCMFCPRQAWNLRKVRHREIESIVSELVALKNAAVRNVWIDDDNMGADQEWSNKLFSAIADINQDHKIQLFISSEVNVAKEFFSNAKKAGVRIVSFGIESGSERMLRAIKKPSNIKLLSSAINNANNAGLFTVGNFIVGLPGESLDDLKLTKRLLCDLPLDEVNIKILSYVRGAPLWDNAVEQNQTLSETSCFFSCKETGTSEFTFKELAEIQQDFYEAFKKSPSRIMRLKNKIRLLGLPYSL